MLSAYWCAYQLLYTISSILGSNSNIVGLLIVAMSVVSQNGLKY